MGHSSIKKATHYYYCYYYYHYHFSLVLLLLLLLQVICREKQQNLADLWRKMYFKNELKYSKRSDHVTDENSLHSDETFFPCWCDIFRYFEFLFLANRPRLPCFHTIK